MKVRRYKPSDWATLSSWMSQRGLVMPPPNQLPKNGFIVDGLATLSLMRTDSKVGFAEYYITNPKADPDERLRAADMLAQRVMQRAATLGVEVLVINTVVPKVIAMCLRHGFTPIGGPAYFFRKNLGEKKDERGSANVVHVSDYVKRSESGY